MTVAEAMPYAEVIGDPIAQSKSPLIHNFWLEKLDLAAEYRAVRVRADGLNAYLATRKIDPAWRGCNVTIPHKQSVIVPLAGVLRSAKQVGAANIVYPSAKGLMGANSDVDGVLESLDAVSLHRDAGITCLIGAGGAARAALYALEVAGMRDLRLLARRPERAQQLLDRFGLAASIHGFDDAEAALRNCNTVINASPLGMTGQPHMPSQVCDAIAHTAADALVLDMVYAPLETALLARAAAEGRRPVDGLTMLIGQADLSFQLFFQAQPPRQFDAELRAILTA